MSDALTDKNNEIIRRLRAEYPHFSELEAEIRRTHPDYDELEIILAACLRLGIAIVDDEPPEEEPCLTRH